jgi:hypothetical protein
MRIPRPPHAIQHSLNLHRIVSPFAAEPIANIKAHAIINRFTIVIIISL